MLPKMSRLHYILALSYIVCRRMVIVQVAGLHNQSNDYLKVTLIHESCLPFGYRAKSLQQTYDLSWKKWV
jgi:hypothetical protein